jgi:hypothetical protein
VVNARDVAQNLSSHERGTRVASLAPDGLGVDQGPVAPMAVLGLQRLAGNRATARLIAVQRCGSTPPEECPCRDGEQPQESGTGTDPPVARLAAGTAPPPVLFGETLPGTASSGARVPWLWPERPTALLAVSRASLAGSVTTHPMTAPAASAHTSPRRSSADRNGLAHPAVVVQRQDAPQGSVAGRGTALSENDPRLNDPGFLICLAFCYLGVPPSAS